MASPIETLRAAAARVQAPHRTTDGEWLFRMPSPVRDALAAWLSDEAGDVEGELARAGSPVHPDVVAQVELLHGSALTFARALLASAPTRTEET
jgi:hypothetical protein